MVHCSGSLSSPLYMKEKVDGLVAVRIFLAAEAVTDQDSYPLSAMLDFADVAAGCSMSSKIDLHKGYHQIPVHPDDIGKTAISTPIGLLEYTCKPFGLRNAGNTFQRKIHMVKKQLDLCFTYQDDVEVASNEDI
jgi:hypothetical protein